MSDTNELNDGGGDGAAQQSNPFKSMTSAGLQEEIWRKEAELQNLERKKDDEKRSNRVMRWAFLFVGIFCFFVLAIATGFWQIVAGVGTVAAGFFVIMSFTPDTKLTEEEGEIEADLYVLRNRWNQAMLD